MSAYEPVERNALLRLEALHREGNVSTPISTGEIEVDAHIALDRAEGESLYFLVTLQRIRVNGSLESFAGELDTASEGERPLPWWRLKCLRKAMEEPLVFAITTHGLPRQADPAVLERYDTWPNIRAFIGSALGEVLFSREFVLLNREIEPQITFTAGLTPLIEAPQVEFAIEKVDPNIVASYASDWTSDGRSGHFSGRMQWDSDNPLLYTHIGTDLFSLHTDQDSSMVTVLRHRIVSKPVS
jgi:hypothetical protein